MSNQTFKLGEDAVLTCSFSKTVDGSSLDPDFVWVEIIRPRSSPVSYRFPSQITKTAIGEYRIVVDCDRVGDWAFRWYSTGFGKTATSGTWRVEK